MYIINYIARYTSFRRRHQNVCCLLSVSMCNIKSCMVTVTNVTINVDLIQDIRVQSCGRAVIAYLQCTYPTYCHSSQYSRVEVITCAFSSYSTSIQVKIRFLAIDVFKCLPAVQHSLSMVFNVFDHLLIRRLPYTHTTPHGCIMSSTCM
jgi:hypothetical protein